MKYRFSLIGLAVALLGNVNAAPVAAVPTDPTTATRYRVFINPFEVKKLGEKFTKSGYTYFPKRVGKVDTAGHFLEVAYAIENLADRHGLVVEKMTSAIALTFEANLSRHQLDALKQDYGVTSIEEVKNRSASAVYSGASTVGDFFSGAEVTTWAKQYVNANQDVSVVTPLYLIDASLQNYGQYDINIISQNNDTGSSFIDHAGHVAGIVGARVNGSGAVGINPSQPIKLFGLNDQLDVAAAFDRAVRNAEVSDQFAVANISLNRDPSKPANPFAYSGVYGRAMRAASNRLLIVQSAGNFDADACDYSYSYPMPEGKAFRANDGIVVAGGLNRVGDRYPATNNDWGGFANAGSGHPLIFPGPAHQIAPVGGSNAGQCVEAWAPAFEITSTVYNFTGGPNHTRVLTGTSFAAPIVGAIASRYGSISTRPIEREAYIRNSLVTTGYSALDLPIRTVQYTDPSTHNIPKRLDIVSSSSPTNSNNLHVLYDGKFFQPTGFWEANSSNGSILFDLGSVKTVVGIRATVRTAVTAENLQMGYAIGVGNDPSTIVETAYHTEPSQFDNAPVYIDIPTVGTRFVRLNASNQHSPLAFSEVEIYGY